MISLLKNIVEVVEFVPDYILFALETVANAFFAAVESLFEFVTSLIPLPMVPAPPSFIANINWFFPIGPVIAVMTPIVAAYVSFLAIRWAYKYAGQL